jgi:hypothetical protein
MAGLNLTGRASASASGSAGVNAALPPSYAASAAGATISARAYGIGSDTAGDAGSKLPAWGGISVGGVAIALLVYLWYSLPR